MGHVDNEIPAASKEIFNYRVTARDECHPDAQFTASIDVHRHREPVLTLTPAWAIGEHRPDGAQQICVD